MTLHGAIYLCLKTRGKLFEKIERLLRLSIIAFVLLFAVSSAYALRYIPHLLDNLRANPYLFVVPVLALLSIANIPRLVSKRKFKSAFVFSALTFSFLLVLLAVELYPTLLFSTTALEHSITIYNAASSDKSLGIMLVFVLIGTPLVLFYTYIVYRTFWGKVELDDTSY